MAFFVGLDLGQAQDYTALVFLEQIRPAPPQPSVQPYRNPDIRQASSHHVPAPIPPAHYQARHLERFPLGTSYPDIIKEVKVRLSLPVVKDAKLVVDATGVGRPVVDMLRQAGLKPIPIVITGGATSSEVDGYWHTPKRELVSTMQVLLQSERLKVAAQLPEAVTLTRELLNFQTRITVAANDTYGAWREGTHDDLVLAVALAAWYAERPRVSIRPRHPSTVTRFF